ncbi:MAG TPA: hypothetical protein PKC28_09465 [Bdellovibrionales bacterium]|nr:hypothetical protein [Bdellovibrionales bacterium]
MLKVVCFHCGAELEFSERVPLRAECDKCRSDAHVCKNCQFYDPKVYNECREPQAEVVMDKERANRCEYFQPGAGAGSTSAPSKNDLLAAAEALFKKKT